MNFFWKFIVFTCLLTQFGFAYNSNPNVASSLQKKNDTKFSKESLSSFQFVRPSIDKGTPNLKNNNRIPAGLNFCPVTLQSLSILRDNTLKIALSDQDLDRYNSVSIFLFPFHFFW